MRRLLFLAGCLFCGSGVLRAEDRPAVVLTGEARAATGQVETIRQHLDAKKWEAALTAIQNVMVSGGDELVPMGSSRAVQVRLVCQRLLASLPTEVRPEVLRLYRGRAEAQARKWLEQGLAEREPRLLRKVVDEAFFTRAAERALDALGDLAFERGRFDEAEQWWRLLTPLEADERAFAYPDPETEPARTRAKQLLARLFRADSHTDEDLAAYRKLHPDAAGKLAGREGRYADLLKAVAAELRQPGAAAPCDWPTFGGTSSRGLLTPATPRQTDRLGALCRRPAWRFDLESRVRLDGPAPPVQWDGRDRKSARSLAFFPIVADDKVFVADACRVTGIDLATGRGEELYDTRAQPGIDLSPPTAADLRYTLTYAADCVLVRLGAKEVRDGRAAKEGVETASRLVCLDLKPGQGERRLRWTLRASPREGGVFEGTPVVQEDQVFVAATRGTADATITAIQCYALEAHGTPPLRWSRDVCETRELQTGERRRRHHLLTLAGRHVVYCSHSGAIVALDALTGRRAWSVRYPTTANVAPELPGIDRPRLIDLTPCLYAGGRLYAAPSDSDRLLCLDPLTGQTLWERKIPEVVHLLGVGGDRLIITTGSGLRALNAVTGAGVWIAPDAGELPPMGRGLLLGDLVLWPTTRGVLLVLQEDGRLAEDPAFLQEVPKGNLAFAHGCLIVTDRSTLTVFAPPARQLEERRRDVERDPDSAETALELGLAEADAEQFDAAVKSLATAERLAEKRPELREEAHAARHAALVSAGKYVEASGKGFSPSERMRALRLSAEQKEKQDPAAAVRVWQSLIEDGELKYERVKNTDGLPRTAGQLAAECIEAILKKHGPTAYAAIEKRAQAAFDAAPKGKERAAALERLTEEFPHAIVRRVALRELMDLYKAEKRACGLYHACERLRDKPGPEDDKQVLLRRYFDAIEAMMPKAQSEAYLPLFRSMMFALEPDEKVPLGAQHMGSAVNISVFTSVALSGRDFRGCIRCRDDWAAVPSWQTPLPFVPEWIAPRFHLVLIGGEQGIAAVRWDDGHLVWFFPARASHFEQYSDRLIFMEEGRLLAVDLKNGMVIWQREAPGAGFLPSLGRFRTNYTANRSRVLVQTMMGRRWLIDSDTGRTLADSPSPAPWPDAPGWGYDRLPLVEDSRRIVVLDMETGREVWSTTVHAPSAISGNAPRVRKEWEFLLVVTQSNLGPRLQRLDAETGKPVWAKMPLLDPESSDPTQWGVDLKTVYLAHGHRITALSLADGKPRWETTLGGPGASWRISREEDFLLLRPSKVTEWRFQFRSPFGAVQWGIGLPPEEHLGSGCPLIALDPATGKVVQRWNLPAGSVRFRCEPIAASIWPGFDWGRASGDAGLHVIFVRGGLVVTLGGRAWGLRPQ